MGFGRLGEARRGGARSVADGRELDDELLVRSLRGLGRFGVNDRRRTLGEWHYE